MHFYGLSPCFGDCEDRSPGLHDVDRLAVGLQASVLVRHAPVFVSDAWCASRIDQRGAHHYGALPKTVDFKAIVERARPR